LSIQNGAILTREDHEGCRFAMRLTVVDHW
jgi:hypothetical protein